MKTSFLQRLALLVASLACLPLAHAQPADIKPPALPEATLAAFPTMTGFRLSPDGKHMLGIESKGDARTILIWDTSNLGAKPKVIGSRGMQIRTASFLKNDMLQVEMFQPYDLRTDVVTKTFITKLLFTDLEGKQWQEPLASAEIARSDEAKLRAALANPEVLSRMPKDPDHVVLISDSRGDGAPLSFV